MAGEFVVGIRNIMTKKSRLTLCIAIVSSIIALIVICYGEYSYRQQKLASDGPLY